MDYSKIRCEDIESCTLREAIVEYGNDIKPLWAHPTNPVESCADANPKLLPNDT